MMDIEEYEKICEKLEKILPLVKDMKIPDKNKTEVRSEISSVVLQFRRIQKRSEECMEIIEEIEPIAKELDGSLVEVERVSSKIHDLLLDKPSIDINLEILESELTKIEVRLLIAFFDCLFIYLLFIYLFIYYQLLPIKNVIDK